MSVSSILTPLLAKVSQSANLTNALPRDVVYSVVHWMDGRWPQLYTALQFNVQVIHEIAKKKKRKKFLH